MMNKFPLITALFLLASLYVPLRSQDKVAPDKDLQSISDPWTPDRLTTPAAINKLLLSRQKEKIVIIHTGPPVLFKEGHIPSALSVGQVGDSAGAKKLQEKLRTLGKDTKIVLYCGCCPWKQCPNVRPAYTIAHAMGFRKVRVLDLPNNFKLDWMKKGFPVEK